MWVALAWLQFGAVAEVGALAALKAALTKAVTQAARARTRTR